MVCSWDATTTYLASPQALFRSATAPRGLAATPLYTIQASIRPRVATRPSLRRPINTRRRRGARFNPMFNMFSILAPGSSIRTIQPERSGTKRSSGRRPPFRFEARLAQVVVSRIGRTANAPIGDDRRHRFGPPGWVGADGARVVFTSDDDDRNIVRRAALQRQRDEASAGLLRIVGAQQRRYFVVSNVVGQSVAAQGKPVARHERAVAHF